MAEEATPAPQRDPICGQPPTSGRTGAGRNITHDQGGNSCWGSSEYSEVLVH